MYHIVVGVPSYNTAATVCYVVKQAALGLERHFPGERGLILVSDGGSQDGTPEVVEALKLSVDKVVERYPGPPGKGSAIRHIMAKALEYGAEGIVLVDSDLRSITPEWIKLLGQAARGRYDLITPLYHRSKYDGMITKHLAYPLTRALYGRRVRQPIGGDFGVSARLAEKLLEEPWADYTYRYGIDIFITSIALATGARVAQADLGSKLHDMKDPLKHLEGMFTDVSGSLFTVALRRIDKWWSISGSTEVELLEGGAMLRCTQPAPVDLKQGIARFKRALAGYASRSVLKELYTEVQEAARRLAGGEADSFPSTLWARVVYRHLAAYARRRSEGVLRSLYACWLGKVAAFIADTAELSDREAELEVQREAECFESEKEYLKQVWGEA